MIRPLPPSTLFPYTTLFRSFQSGKIAGKRCRRCRVCRCCRYRVLSSSLIACKEKQLVPDDFPSDDTTKLIARSEEHTSELQSHSDLVCRLLLEKKKNKSNRY